jgi:hypothetical protein
MIIKPLSESMTDEEISSLGYDFPTPSLFERLVTPFKLRYLNFMADPFKLRQRSLYNRRYKHRLFKIKKSNLLAARTAATWDAIR